MDYLVSTSSNDYMMAIKAKGLVETDTFYKEFATDR